MERRFLETEVRMQADDSGRWIVGYAVKWETLSLPLWIDQRTGKPVREQFRHGAFLDVLARPELDIVGLRDHNRSLLLGRTLNETAILIEDATGLNYRVKPPDTTEGRDTLTLLDGGYLRGSSFSFSVPPGGDEWEEREDALIRTVIRVDDVDDVGPVTRPAYPSSEAEARSLDATQRSLTRHLTASLIDWEADAQARLLILEGLR